MVSITLLSVSGRSQMMTSSLPHPPHFGKGIVEKKQSEKLQSDVFLTKADFLPLATTLTVADSTYTDTTGNWYLLGIFGESTQNITLNGTDTTVTLYTKGLGVRFNNPTTIKSNRIDSVAVSLVIRSLAETDSLLCKVVPVWDRQTTGGDILPFPDYYGNTGTIIGQAKIAAADLTVDPTVLQTITFKFGGTGRSLSTRPQYAVVIQTVGPNPGLDTLQFQMQANLDVAQDPFVVDTDLYRTYSFNLTDDNNVYNVGWAADIQQRDENGDPTGNAFFGNAIVISYLHGTSTADVVAGIRANELLQNSPNPVSGSTMISYSLADSRPVSLGLFNELGNQVASLVNSTQGFGDHNVTFDASKLPNGTYYYKLQAGDYTATRMMVVAK